MSALASPPLDLSFLSSARLLLRAETRFSSLGGIMADTTLLQ